MMKLPLLVACRRVKSLRKLYCNSQLAACNCPVNESDEPCRSLALRTSADVGLEFAC